MKIIGQYISCMVRFNEGWYHNRLTKWFWHVLLILFLYFSIKFVQVSIQVEPCFINIGYVEVEFYPFKTVCWQIMYNQVQSFYMSIHTHCLVLQQCHNLNQMLVLPSSMTHLYILMICQYLEITLVCLLLWCLIQIHIQIAAAPCVASFHILTLWCPWLFTVPNTNSIICQSLHSWKICHLPLLEHVFWGLIMKYNMT